MYDLVGKIALVIFSQMAASSLGRFYAHMYQLNGYKTYEEWTWLKKNAYENFGRGLGVLISIFVPWPIGCFLYLWTFWGNKPDKTRIRKPIAYTGRLKRILSVAIIIHITIYVLSFIFLKGILFRLVIAMSLLLTPFVMMLANLFLKPVQKAIDNYYIRDSLKVLKNSSCKIIGITGSYGKTSVKNILTTILSEKYSCLPTPGNVNTPLGICRVIRGDLSPFHELFICEMGARRTGEIKEICDYYKPDYGIITSIGDCHLETFKSRENIRKTKFELFDAAKETVLNLRDENICLRLEELGKKDLSGNKPEICDNNAYNQKLNFIDDEVPGGIIPCGYGKFFNPYDMSIDSDGMHFKVLLPSNEELSLCTKLLGDYQVMNICAAIALAYRLGLNSRQITNGVSKIAPIKNRLELKKYGDCTILDDAYNSNPKGANTALEVLSHFPGKKILITPGMVELGDKHQEKNEEFGVAAAKVCDIIFLISSNADPVEDGLKKAGFKEYVRLNDFNTAYSQAMAMKCEKTILIENDVPDQYL
ncbi:MAG: UDP-N-acetylmuramoyl-tripeptide--D-alanyl-D-alanine ligase [Lachnospiraceae bacterium]|nr:UDP-N-acetylmuramoyl-tripeptide--D-alanyl-D-alanine ligase [Lachnospiraceae bacterium]